MPQISEFWRDAILGGLILGAVIVDVVINDRFRRRLRLRRQGGPRPTAGSPVPMAGSPVPPRRPALPPAGAAGGPATGSNLGAGDA